MQNNRRIILIVGAGRSSSSLIQYLLNKSEEERLQLIIADLSLESAQDKAKNHPNASAIALDIFDAKQREAVIPQANLVISMLPASLHIEVAKDCITYKKHLVTASYISEAMQELDTSVKENHLIFMNEIGLDPGIDHMSAMKIINEIKQKGGKIVLFESSCGGLIAPESDTNSWNYKFTWAPRNVVLAGQGGTAKFLQQGCYKYIPYTQLFSRTQTLEIEGYGEFETYANRDSLKYQAVYGLGNLHTICRGTIRRAGFSKAWNLLVQLGMTDDSYVMEDSEHMSYRQFTNAFLPYHPTETVENKTLRLLKIAPNDILWQKLIALDLFNPKKKIELKNATPAQILQKMLSDTWSLQANDKDMVVMHHKFAYEINGEQEQIVSKMICLGQDQTYTAMAKTVGLPVAIASLLILNGKISKSGVQLPILPEVYEPILEELSRFGIIFKETKTCI